MTRISTLIAVAIIACISTTRVSGSEMPLSEIQERELESSITKSLEQAIAKVKEDSDSIDAYSRRGDAYFFIGRFQDAVSDYDKMIELDETQSASHWRRGIALFYADRFKDAAAQFESYHSFDQVDRENGIWRYLSQHRANGRDSAREGLLKYKKDDREPFPSVYKLFAGTMTADQILKNISEAEISKLECEQRLFYAHLYIGLNHYVEGQTIEAHEHLVAATRNTWAPTAPYGPKYMWHVGRLHEQILRKKLPE